MHREGKHICFDGGPSAGKTTVLAVARQQLEQKDYHVTIVPEAPTIIIEGGFRPDKSNPIEFQNLVAKLQDAHEKLFREYALSLYPDKKHVFLYDRGILSGAAYLGNLNEPVDFERFEKNVLKLAIGETCEGARARYDAVIHLVTAADGALDFYTLENNRARSEGPELARQLDARTKNTWLGHGHLRVVTNRRHDNTQKSFDEKIDDAMNHIYATLGIPIPIEDEDKFLIQGNFNPQLIPVSYVVINIEQTYLRGKYEERVRKRMSELGQSYYHTIKKPGPDNTRFETERSIQKEEYEELLLRADPKLIKIKKRRFCFLFEEQYFEMDIFGGERHGLILVEREKTKDNPTTKMPKFLGHYTDVGANPAYQNRAIAEPSWTL